MRIPTLILGLAMASCVFAAEEREVIAIIAPLSLPGKTLDSAELGLIYRCKKMLWPDGTRIQPTNLPPEHALRRQFSQLVLGKTPEALISYWNNQYYHGISPPRVFASEEAVLRFVAETPGAIGYVHGCKPDNLVKVLMWIQANGQPTQQAPVCD